MSSPHVFEEPEIIDVMALEFGFDAYPSKWPLWFRPLLKKGRLYVFYHRNKSNPRDRIDYNGEILIDDESNTVYVILCGVAIDEDRNVLIRWFRNIF
jgi:hypothetical protein